METTDRRSAGNGGRSSGELSVTVHQCSPDRLVFVEEDNPDAWIATDTVLDVLD